METTITSTVLMDKFHKYKCSCDNERVHHLNIVKSFITSSIPRCVISKKNLANFLSPIYRCDRVKFQEKVINQRQAMFPEWI